MKTIRIWVVFATCLAISQIFAQNKTSLSGTIIERETNEPVVAATVRLMSLPDSVLVDGISTDTMGVFRLVDVKEPKHGKRLSLKISCIGYVTRFMDLTDVRKGDNSLGFITLQPDVRVMNEAVVTAAAHKVRVDGDSLVYDPAAYRLQEGSTLEALVKLLPGAKIDDDGKITINGKEVNKILVDGKEFFLNDKDIAMKNIPVEMIEKVKSYERKSDLTRITGIDDGEEETVLDLSVKKGMKQGWFGNANTGYGTERRYNNRVMANRFRDDNNFTLLGSIRNTPERWGWGGNSGLHNTKEIGSNFTVKKEKLEVGGSVNYRYRGSDVENASEYENFVATRGKLSQSLSTSLSANHNLDGNLRLEWKPDTMTNIMFRPNFGYSKGFGFGEYTSCNYDADELTGLRDTVNTNNNRNNSTNHNVWVNGFLQYNRKFNNKGRNITFRMDGGFSQGRNEQLSAADITYRKDATSMQNDRNNRYYNTPSQNYNLSGRVTYSEPIADRTYLQFSYQYNYSYSRNDRKAYVYDSDAYQMLSMYINENRYDIENALLLMQQAGWEMRDTVALSQFSEYRNYNHRIGLQFRRVRDKYNLSFGVDALPQRTKLNYKYMGREYPEVERNVFNMAPRVYFKYNFSKQTNLEFRYNGRTSQPSMTNLLDITDDSDPLNISRGNPELKPSFSHRLNGHFNTYNAERQRGLWSYLYANVTHNGISNKTTYDPVTGIRTTKPMNINGNWSGGTGAGFNTAMGKKKLFFLSLDAHLHYSHNVGYYNNATSQQTDIADITSITHNINTSGTLQFSYRNDKIDIGMRGSLNYQHMKNNVTDNGNNNTYRFSYGPRVEWTLPWGTKLSTDYAVQCRRGYSQQDMNTNEMIWNASISHSFLKGKALTIKGEFFDILGQQSTISRSVSEFGRSDNRTNDIYQYGMLSVIYRFSIIAGKNTMGTKEERKEQRW
ncbi:MAG: outer membrane beta-barrel protein [Bacteroidaceae bacterium]|nr:outer membrane beta-barrel protein [Bacteroidaceae bacterium]